MCRSTTPTRIYIYTQQQSFCSRALKCNSDAVLTVRSMGRLRLCSVEWALSHLHLAWPSAVCCKEVPHLVFNVVSCWHVHTLSDEPTLCVLGNFKVISAALLPRGFAKLSRVTGLYSGSGPSQLCSFETLLLWANVSGASTELWQLFVRVDKQGLHAPIPIRRRSGLKGTQTLGCSRTDELL